MKPAHTLVYRYGPHHWVLRWRTHDDLGTLLADLPVDGESLDELAYCAIVAHAGQMAIDTPHAAEKEET